MTVMQGHDVGLQKQSDTTTATTKTSVQKSNFLTVHKNMTRLKYKIRWPFYEKSNFWGGLFSRYIKFYPA